MKILTSSGKADMRGIKMKRVMVVALMFVAGSLYADNIARPINAMPRWALSKIWANDAVHEKVSAYDIPQAFREVMSQSTYDLYTYRLCGAWVEMNLEGKQVILAYLAFAGLHGYYIYWISR